MARLTWTRHHTNEVSTLQLLSYPHTNKGPGAVWSEEKQMEIVDSLFHNFYVPPIILAVMRDEEGDEIRICVDGRQRLTSIVRFLGGSVCFQFLCRSILE
jgi:hypothetical protein